MTGKQRRLAYIALAVALAIGVPVGAAVAFRSAIPFGTAGSWSSAVGSDPNAVRGPWFNTAESSLVHTNTGGAGTDWQLDQIQYSVKAFGAKGDGTTDDTTAIQNAINAIPTAGGILFFPTGIYKITSMLDINNRQGFAVMGSGSGELSTTSASVLRWAGAANGTVLRVFSSRWSYFQNFTVDCASSAGIGIDYTALNATSPSQENHFSNITIRSCTGTPGRGLHVGSSTNDQVSESTFDGMVYVGNVVNIYQDGSQTIDIQYRGGDVSAATSIGMDIVGGSVTTFNVDFENGVANTVDVQVEATAGRVTFVDNYHEDTNGATQKAYNFPSGNRTYASSFLGGQVLYTSTAGGTVFNYQQQGPVVMSGMMFTSNAANQGGTITFNGPGPSANDISLPGTVFYNSNALSVAGSSRVINTLSSSLAAVDTAGVPVTFRGGNGGPASAVAGGAGGTMTFQAPAGGNGTAALAAGRGADAVIGSGPAGSNLGGGGAASGDVKLNVGLLSGAGAQGRIRFQDNGTNRIGVIVSSAPNIYCESANTCLLGGSGSSFGVGAFQHIEGGGSAPTIAVGAATQLGTTPAAAITAGNDSSVTISISTGTTPAAFTAGTGGAITAATITNNATWSGIPRGCVLVPANAAAAVAVSLGVVFYCDQASTSTTQYVVKAASNATPTLAASTAMLFAVHEIR
jgi:hypothetical protein